MSCPYCGTSVYRKSFISLFVLASLAIVSFGVSLLVLPFELFFVFSFILLFGLRYIERQLHSIDKKEIRCTMCGRVVNVAHSH
jgi:uncharacterized membrane protein